MTIRKSLFWSMTQQFGMMGLQLVQMMLIARLLSPDEIGIFVLTFSVVIIIQGLRDMGLAQYLIREPELRDDTIRAVFGLSIALCTVLALTLWLGRHTFAGWIGTPQVADVLLPIVVTIVIFPAEQTASALLRRDMRFDVLARIALSSKLASSLATIGLALAGFSTMALVWGVLVDSVLRTVLLTRAEPRHFRLRPSLRGWRPLIGFGSWATGASLAGQATVEGNKLLVGGILGPGATAFFDRAVRIPGVVRKGLFAPLGQVMLPAFSQDLRQGRSIGPKVERLTAITTGMVWPTFAVLAVLADEVVRLMLGPQWGQSAVILPWLLLAQSLLSLLPQPNQILVPFGHMRRLFTVRMVQMGISLGISFVSLQWGLEAFAMARPLNTMILIVVIWIGISPYMDVGIRRLLRGHMQSAAMMLSTVAPVAAWKYAGLGHGSYLALLALLVLAALFGLSTALALKHPLGDELCRIVTWAAARIRRGTPEGSN